MRTSDKIEVTYSLTVAALLPAVLSQHLEAAPFIQSTCLFVSGALAVVAAGVIILVWRNEL